MKKRANRTDTMGTIFCTQFDSNVATNFLSHVIVSLLEKCNIEGRA